MNYVRILFFGAIAFGSTFFGWDVLQEAFGEQRDVYVIVGILNYWAIFSCMASSLIIILYCSVEIVTGKSLSVFLKNGIIISCLLISPLISFSLKELTLHRINDYVQCDTLSKVTSRFTSKTYAVTTEQCRKIAAEN